MKAFIFSALLFLMTSVAAAQDQKAILDILETQRSAWNKGNLEDFMQTYWKSDSLLFVGQSGPKYGWQTTLDNYRKSYPNRAAMGTLSFDIKEVRFLTRDDAFVLGAWHLQREKDAPNGYFTILLRKIDGQWKIIADHSS